MSDLVCRIKDAARALGFSVTGITSVDPLPEHITALFEWRRAGYAAGMEYMTRRGDLHGTPKTLVPTAMSLVSLAVNHYSASPAFEHENRFGRVARYAWGRDYHDVIKPRLLQLAAQIESLAGSGCADGFKSRSFVDAVPLLERAVAHRAGLGFFGKNTNLLQPLAGSWFFLAEILINVELPSHGERTRVHCGSCTRCLSACPTEAFPSPYILDSNRCISYLTIENKGAIPRRLRTGLGEWVFGCDVCQEVCPFNRFSSDTDWPELKPEAGPGARVDLIDLLTIETEREFRNRFAGTALLRPKRRGLLRNAAIVAANIECTAAVPALAELVERDREPLIRSHALYALSRLDRPRARAISERVMATDPDDSVREEARAVIDPAADDRTTGGLW